MFISFRHLAFKSSAYILPEEQEAKKPRIVAQTDEILAVVVDKTSISSANFMSILQSAPMAD